MRRGVMPRLIAGVILLILFAAFTAAIMFVDVRPIGPEGSSVGLATFNEACRMPYNAALHKISDLLGYAALGVVGCFGLVGLCQWIHRKSLSKVDFSILLLGAFYVLTLVLYILFDKIGLNYRPVILDEGLEPSYPSSHTVLSVGVFSTAIPHFRYLLRRRPILRSVLTAFAMVALVLLVLCRTFCGVHWMTDIIGSLLLSASMVMLYFGLIRQFAPRKRNRKAH